MAATGQFVLTWQSPTTSSAGTERVEIFVQRYAANGTKIGGVIPMPRLYFESIEDPAVAMAPDGAFSVTWRKNVSIYLQRYGANGSPLFAPVIVSHTTPAYTSGLAVDALGGTSVTWLDGSDVQSVWVRRFDATGAGDSAIDVATLEGQVVDPAIAMDADGDAVAVWGQFTAEASLVKDAWAAYQRLRGPEPVDLAVTQTDSANFVKPSSSFTYNIDVSNLHAPSSATGIALVDQGIGTALQTTIRVQLSNLGLKSIGGSGWTCSTMLAIYCTYGGPLTAGAKAPSVVLTVNAPSTTGTVSSTVTLQPVQIDSQPGNDTDVETTSVISFTPL
jgi:hypothetical protein